MTSVAVQSLLRGCLNGVRNTRASSAFTSPIFSSSASNSITSDRQFSTSSNLRDEETEEVPSGNVGGVRSDPRFHNHVTLMGRVGRTPRSFGSGPQEVTFLDLLTKRYYESNGEVREEPHFHRLMVTNGTPDVHNYVKARVQKGDRIFVEGSLRYQTKETKDGKMKKEPAIRVDDLIMVAAAR